MVRTVFIFYSYSLPYMGIKASVVSQLDFTLRWPWCGIVTRPPRHFMTYIYVYFKSPAVWPKI